MKSIAAIGKRLISVFLVMVVSSLMLLTSPAIAANSVILNWENTETEILQSDKPVVVILASQYTLEYYKTSLEDLKAKAEKFFGDKYKIAVGKTEENRQISYMIPTPQIYPPVTTVSVFKSGELSDTRFTLNPTNLTQAFESLKSSFER